VVGVEIGMREFCGGDTPSAHASRGRVISEVIPLAPLEDGGVGSVLFIGYLGRGTCYRRGSRRVKRGRGEGRRRVGRRAPDPRRHNRPFANNLGKGLGATEVSLQVVTERKPLLISIVEFHKVPGRTELGHSAREVFFVLRVSDAKAYSDAASHQI